MFFDIWKYIYSETVFNTLYIEIKYNVNKKLLQTKKHRLMHGAFFCDHQLFIVLLLICDS